MPDAWDRRNDEPPIAYQAFLCYRDLKPPRSIRESYRRFLGNDKATQGSGQYNKWPKQFAWVDRTIAWDAHAFEVGKAAEARAIVATGFKPIVERHKAVKELLDYGYTCLQRGRTVLNFPLVDKRVVKTVKAKSGEVFDLETKFEGMDSRNLAIAARVGQIGGEMLRSALDQAEAAEAGMPTDVGLNDYEMTRAVNEATRLWEDWQAEQQRKRDEARPQLMPPAENETGQEVAG